MSGDQTVTLRLITSAKETVQHLRECQCKTSTRGCIAARDIADQIEAQTKPPRIPEPGLWGVVEAKLRPEQTFSSRYVRRYNNAGYDWVTVNSAEVSKSLRWDDLIDPVLVREGLS